MKPMRRLLLLLAVILAATPSYADDAQAISQVEKYLSSLKTLVASFRQVEADGRTATGKFFLKRPGKMRWQYDPPAPILLVSDGTTITYYDADIDQVNYIPVDESLASFLAEPTIMLNGKTTKLTRFTQDDGIITATIARRDEPEQGTLTLVFKDNPITIHQMIVKDGTGKENTVTFEDGRIGVVLPDTLFTFQDPRGTTPRSRRE